MQQWNCYVPLEDRKIHIVPLIHKSVSEGKNRLGFTQKQLKTILDFCTEAGKEPRLSYSEFHRRYNPYSRKQSTIKLLNKAYSRTVITGPFIYCNRGIEVTLIKDERSPLKMLKEKKHDNETNYAIALSGDWSLISFKYGASTLEHTCTVIPASLSSTQVEVEDLMFYEEGKLEPDPYPHGWDELDWSIYELLDYPREVSYLEVGKKLGVSWKTVQYRFKKMLTQCKTLSCFFPFGYSGYNKLFVTFRTKYEVGLVKALRKLDRTTYLWKSRDTIILSLFFPPEPMSYNRGVERLKELEERGVIHDLHVSIPIRWYNVFF